MLPQPFLESLVTTPRKTNMEPENEPLENEPLEEEIPTRNHHFQVPCKFSRGVLFGSNWDAQLTSDKWIAQSSDFIAHPKIGFTIIPPRGVDL